MGHLAPASGTVRRGRALRIGELTQAHETLPRGETARSHVASDANISRFDAGQALHRVGLGRFQVDVPISDLNPGARVRVVLALFGLRRVNALLLDEPTNHLDAETLDALAACVDAFEGTAFVVSHDVAFLQVRERRAFAARTTARGIHTRTHARAHARMCTHSHAHTPPTLLFPPLSFSFLLFPYLLRSYIEDKRSEVKRKEEKRNEGKRKE